MIFLKRRKWPAGWRHTLRGRHFEREEEWPPVEDGCITWRRVCTPRGETDIYEAWELIFFSSNDKDRYFVKRRKYICCHIITIYIQGSRSVIIQRERLCFFIRQKGLAVVEGYKESGTALSVVSIQTKKRLEGLSKKQPRIICKTMIYCGSISNSK